MDHPTSHEDDVYAWAYEQSGILRHLRETRRDLPNELDIENICEEIEGLARTDLREAESFLRLVFLHLLKVASAPDLYPVDHWKTEIAVLQASFATLATRTILRKIRIEKVWELALGQATAQLRREGDSILCGLPRHCPFVPEQIAAESFEIDAAIDLLRRRAAEAAKARF